MTYPDTYKSLWLGNKFLPKTRSEYDKMFVRAYCNACETKRELCPITRRGHYPSGVFGESDCGMKKMKGKQVKLNPGCEALLAITDEIYLTDYRNLDKYWEVDNVWETYSLPDYPTFPTAAKTETPEPSLKEEVRDFFDALGGILRRY